MFKPFSLLCVASTADNATHGSEEKSCANPPRRTALAEVQVHLRLQELRAGEHADAQRPELADLVEVQLRAGLHVQPVAAQQTVAGLPDSVQSRAGVTREEICFGAVLAIRHA